MTDPSSLAPASQRDALRARIEAAERRNAERSLADDARAAAAAAADYTRAHPLTVIGGALTVGLLIGLLTRPGRRVAGKVVGSAADAVNGAAASAGAGVKGLAARGGAGLSRMAGEAAAAFAMSLIDEALDAARAGQDRAEALGDAAGSQAKKLGAKTAEVAGSTAERTRTLARRTSAAAVGAVRDLARKTKR